MEFGWFLGLVIQVVKGLCAQQTLFTPPVKGLRLYLNNTHLLLVDPLFIGSSTKFSKTFYITWMLIVINIYISEANKSPKEP